VEGDATVSARDRLFDDIWDMRSATEKNALIDAHRDEVALEIGRDALRDGLVPTLIRLVGEANAAKLMAEIRTEPAARHCGQQKRPHGVHLWETAEGDAGAVTGLWYCPGGEPQ
jgi:hypothetical protein